MKTTVSTNNLSKIITGIQKAANIIISTMGGTGKNVIMLSNGGMTFTKDGVSVAKQISFKDPEENAGAMLLINAANKTVSECGDGTTLTSLLISSLTTELFQTLKPTTDINALIENIRNDIEIVEKELINRASQIETNHDIYSIAYSSVKSSVLAKFIADIYASAGLNANISLEMSRTSNKTYYETIKGLNFESGFVHTGFANNDYGKCVFEGAYIHIVDGEMASPDDFYDLIDEKHNQKVPIVFLAERFSEAFIRFALRNKQSAGVKICLIKLPGYGKGIKENVKDIKAFINNDGIVDKIVIDLQEFTLFNNTNKLKIKKRVDQLKKLAEGAIEDYDEKDYLKRIYRLEGSSAIIYVGGYTEKNAKEEYDRLEDAVGAVKSAIKSGYVRGAGLELYEISELCQTDIMKNILKYPYHKILSNANIDISQLKRFDLPYNTRTKTYDNNIIDPILILIRALQNSFALVELLINTSYFLYNE